MKGRVFRTHTSLFVSTSAREASGSTQAAIFRVIFENHLTPSKKASSSCRESRPQLTGFTFEQAQVVSKKLAVYSS